MAKTITLPSGLEVTIANRTFEFRGPLYSPRSVGAVVDVIAQDFITLTEEDVAELANHLPVCAGCGEFKLKGHDCPVER